MNAKKILFHKRHELQEVSAQVYWAVADIASLPDRVALVTGANRGLGLGLASPQALADKGRRGPRFARSRARLPILVETYRLHTPTLADRDDNGADSGWR
jgi:hypothetical protein